MADHHLSKKYRLRQVLRYLESKYITPFPVKLRFTKVCMTHEKGCTYRHGKKLNIVINLRLNMYHAVETLIHEYAHARTWRHERIEKIEKIHHGPDWGVSYAELWQDFYDCNDEGTCGAAISKKF